MLMGDDSQNSTLQKSSSRFQHTACHRYAATPEAVPIVLTGVSLLRHHLISADQWHLLCFTC